MFSKFCSRDSIQFHKSSFSSPFSHPKHVGPFESCRANCATAPCRQRLCQLQHRRVDLGGWRRRKRVRHVALETLWRDSGVGFPAAWSSRRSFVYSFVLSFFFGIPTTFLTKQNVYIAYCFASFFSLCGFEARGAAAAARSGAAVPRRAWRRCRKRFQQLGKLKWSC